MAVFALSWAPSHKVRSLGKPGAVQECSPLLVREQVLLTRVLDQVRKT